MTVAQYLDAVKERLLTDRIVARFQLVRERLTLSDGHLRARLTLIDGSRLEFSEYVQLFPDDRIDVVTYSYHWADENDNLIRRWDNTPHYPDLPNSPHHVHSGLADLVSPGQPMSIFAVLDEIAAHLKSDS